MKKGWISVSLGLIVGAIISYFTLNYDGWTIHYYDGDGNRLQTIHELDINLLMNGFIIIVAVSALIYFIWTIIEKKVSKT